MSEITTKQLEIAISRSWDSVTTSIPQGWSEANAMRGQCVPSALVVQDYLGGDIERVGVIGNEEVEGETHYRSRLDSGLPVDFTVMQYLPFAPVRFIDRPVDLDSEGYSSMRERLLDNDLTRSRYEVLKSRVALGLGRRVSGMYDMSYQPEDEAAVIHLQSLRRTLGVHAERLLVYVASDNPDADSDTVLALSSSAMCEGAAYMQPAYPWDIVDSSINMYRAYKQ